MKQRDVKCEMKINGNGKKTLGNILWMLFDKVFKFGFSFLVTLFVANHYGASDYGTYQYAISMVAMFELLTYLVDATVVKKFYVDYDEKEVVLASTLARVLMSVAAGIAGSVYLLLYNGDSEYNFIFVVLLWSSLIGSIQFGITNRFEYLLKSKKIVLASDCAAFVSFGLQLLAVYLDLPVSYIAVIALISTTITMLITYVLYRREFGKIVRGKLNTSLFKRIIIDSLPFAVATACTTIYTKCDSIMIGEMLSKADVGIYAIAIKLISVVEIAVFPIRESVYPNLLRLNAQDKKEYEKYYIKVSSILTWLCIVGVALSFVVLPYIFTMMSAEYMESLSVYRIYVLGSFFVYNSCLRAGHFAMTNQGKIVMISQIVSVVLNLIVNYIAIQYIGVFGAAVATVVTQFASLFALNIFFAEGRKVLVWQIKALNPMHFLRKSK